MFLKSSLPTVSCRLWLCQPWQISNCSSAINYKGFTKKKQVWGKTAIPSGLQIPSLARMTLDVNPVDHLSVTQFQCTRLTELRLQAYRQWSMSSMKWLCASLPNLEIFPLLEKLRIRGFPLWKNVVILDTFSGLTRWPKRHKFSLCCPLLSGYQSCGWPTVLPRNHVPPCWRTLPSKIALYVL